MFLASIGTEPKAMVMKLSFTYRFQDLQYTLLDQSIQYCWYAQRSFLVGIAIFGNFYTEYTLRFIPCQFPLYQCNQLFVRESFQILDCFSVCSSGFTSMVGLDIPICQTYVVRQSDYGH